MLAAATAAQLAARAALNKHFTLRGLRNVKFVRVLPFLSVSAATQLIPALEHLTQSQLIPMYTQLSVLLAFLGPRGAL
jgi:hypothetical protein